MKPTAFLAAAGAALALTAAPAFAHHSRAMFDTTKTISITGTVKEVQWTNPHIWIEVMAPNDKGEITQWSLEGSAPVLLVRRGWRPTSVKPGEQVTVSLNPLRSGKPGGSLRRIAHADGTVVGDPQSD